MFSTTETERHFDEIVGLIAPQGRFGVISGIGASKVESLSGKSVTLCYELMFTRSNFQTSDLIEQHNILREISQLVDAGRLKNDAAPPFRKNLRTEPHKRPRVYRER